ncbi:MAG: oligosaccharide flippase family protein [Methanobacteriaceae archaeon]|nr:oligosaccharide flippase family protein [Methanobacteriaceae archaeon]
MKNSYFLIGNSLLFAGVGFVFWIIAARLYSTTEIGLGAAIISAMNFLSLFALLGFDISIIHYLPLEKNKEKIINSSFLITILLGTIISLIFLFGLEIWAPALISIKENLFFCFFFVFFSVFCALSNLQISVFTGLRDAKYSFYQSLTNISRILVLPLFIALNAFGIFISFSLTFFLAFILGNKLIINVLPEYKFLKSININVIKKMFSYSFKNYISNTFLRMPDFILPLMVINTLGAEINAYFYISWALSSILLTIPISTSKSLLAEGSYSPDLFKKNVYRSIKNIFLILILLILIILLFGKYILLIFGENYSNNAYYVLILSALASLPYSVNALYSTIKRVKKEMNAVIIIYGCLVLFSIIFGYYFMHLFGLIGIGLAWLFSNIIVLIIVFIDIKLISPLFKDHKNR